MRQLRQSVELCRQLRESEPSRLEHLRKQAFMTSVLGRLLDRIGREAEAETILRDCRDAVMAASIGFPDDPRLQANLASTRSQLAHVLSGTGRPDEAEQEYRAAIEIREGLLALDPGHARALSELASVLSDSSEIYLGQRRWDEALPVLERAIETEEEVLEASPGNPSSQRRMVIHHQRLSDALLGLGRVEESAAAARRTTSYRPADPRAFVLAAARLCGCATELGGEHAEALADEAMELLRKAVELGYQDVPGLRQMRGLTPLHERSDFKELTR